MVKLLHDVHGRRFHQIHRLRRADALNLDALLVLQEPDEVLLIRGVERHRGSLFACASSSPGAVDVHVHVRRRVGLHNEVHGWHIQTSRCHVSGHEAPDASGAEAIHHLLTLVLPDISVQHSGAYGSKLFVGSQLVTLFLGACEHDSLAEVPSMNFAQVPNAVPSHQRRTGDTLVGDHFVGGITILLLDHVDPRRIDKVLCNDGVDPTRQSCRKQQLLEVLLWKRVQDGLYILLKSHRQHLVCLV
mmetsp:Transcript_27990/g.44876  ORF Transcript_27990/g.44876 Transcript_27990/m.44876 type:complete len:245 (-) Transcript_27990:502-1236(-)